MGDPTETPQPAPDYANLAVLSPATFRSAKVVALFLKHVPVELGNIESAIRSKDGDQLRQVAHKLKGSCRAVGVLRMAALCESLERGAAKVAEAAPHYAGLLIEFERAKALLEAGQAPVPR
jgi:HPt (histidine-containing phosphotransfer) domain-containing protein